MTDGTTVPNYFGFIGWRQVEKLMTDTIATRIFDIIEDGKVETASVYIEKPCLKDGGQDWICRVRIEKPDGDVIRNGHGVDSMQALILAFAMLKLEVEELQRQYGRNISFLGDTDLQIELIFE